MTLRPFCLARVYPGPRPTLPSRRIVVLIGGCASRRGDAAGAHPGSGAILIANAVPGLTRDLLFPETPGQARGGWV